MTRFRASSEALTIADWILRYFAGHLIVGLRFDLRMTSQKELTAETWVGPSMETVRRNPILEN